MNKQVGQVNSDVTDNVIVNSDACHVDPKIKTKTHGPKKQSMKKTNQNVSLMSCFYQRKSMALLPILLKLWLATGVQIDTPG